MRNFFILLIALCLTAQLQAQFNRGTFTQVGPPGSVSQNNNQQKENGDKPYVPKPPSYTLKRYFKSLAGKDSMKVQHMWMGSLILPGTAQIYNRQYWKLPIVYGGMGALIYGGYKNNMEYLKSGDGKYRQRRDLFYVGAVLTYWGSIMDGVVNYKYFKKVLPARASLYSAMLPGLGQAYNGDYWKIPIFYGGFITCGYFIYSNQNQYKRYRNLYNWASQPNSDYDGKYSVETLKWYRDTYRRYRDYSVIAGALVYILNIVDANVFAHLQSFDVSDDLSINISPEVINPIAPQYAYTNPSIGVKLNLTF